MKKWIILFVRTGAEERLAETIAKVVNADEFFPFVPTRMASFRRRGVFSKIKKILFPGYIFIETELAVGLITQKLKDALAEIPHRSEIYSILHYCGNKNDVTMRDKEREYWERLLTPNTGYCVEESVGYIIGDVIRVTSGPLVGMESKIKKINRHKREAIVEAELMGDVRTLKLMLDIVEKIK